MNNPEIVAYLLNLPQLDLRFKRQGSGVAQMGGADPFNPLFYCIKRYDYNKVRILCKRASKLRKTEKAMILVQNRHGYDPCYYALLMIERLLRTFRSESEYFILDQAVAAQVNALVSIVEELVRYDTQFQDTHDFLTIERAYNREVAPGVTLLWKCVSLDQVALVELLLTKLPGTGRPLAAINQTDRQTGQSVIMKLLDEDLSERRCAGLLSENIKENLVRVLLAHKPNLLLTDVSAKNAFQISEQQAEELGVDDYLLPHREHYFNALGDGEELAKLRQDPGLLVAAAMTTTDEEGAAGDRAGAEDLRKQARRSPDLMTSLEQRLERIATTNRTKQPKPRDDGQQLVFVDVEDASHTDESDDDDSQAEAERERRARRQDQEMRGADRQPRNTTSKLAGAD